MIKAGPEEIKSVLVIKLRHIGDVLLTTPVFRALKGAYPGAKINAVVLSGTEEMLTLNPNIDEIVPFRKGQGILYELGFIKRIRALKPDLAINMTEGDRGAVISLVSGAKYRIGVDPMGKGFFGKKYFYTEKVPYRYGKAHKVLMDLGLLGPLGIKPGSPAPELYTSPEDDEAVREMLAAEGISDGQPVAVVHPTSRWLFKCWRDEAVAEIIDYLEDRGVRTVLTSGPDEREMRKAANIFGFARRKPVNLSGRLTLKRLAALFKRSSLFFGVDTAPMHMAAAVGTPVVALFGPSDSKTWGPFSYRSSVVAKAGDFQCIPCNKDGCGGSKKSRCLEAITVEEAIKAIDEVLAVRIS